MHYEVMCHDLAPLMIQMLLVTVRSELLSLYLPALDNFFNVCGYTGSTLGHPADPKCSLFVPKFLKPISLWFLWQNIKLHTNNTSLKGKLWNDFTIWPLLTPTGIQHQYKLRWPIIYWTLWPNMIRIRWNPLEVNALPNVMCLWPQMTFDILSIHIITNPLMCYNPAN